MTKQFRIYLKNGLIFELEMRRFTIDEQKFTFYDTDNYEIENVFILFSEIVAIIPSEFYKSEQSEVFQVYLKKHNDPVEIMAYNFEFNEASKVIFNQTNYSSRMFPIEDIYVTSSEVLAIFPANRLKIPTNQT